MISQVRIFLFLLLLSVAACHSDNEKLVLASDWHADLLAEYDRAMPDMITISPNNKLLYIACETSSNKQHPSLIRMDISTGNHEVMLYGMQRADGLKLASDGSLWLGEETGNGIIWRIRNPATLPINQHIDRQHLLSTHPDITPVIMAGRFSHEGLEFSADHKFCYLGDEWAHGSLYRLRLSGLKLSVMHETKGWLPINKPLDARTQAKNLHGAIFARLEDMSKLPNGDILMTETGVGNNPGRILLLKDSASPAISTYLQDPRITHPDNLEWDQYRGWLWITDDSIPSELWAWDGKFLHLIASHPSAEITGVITTNDGTVFINLQGKRFTSDATVKLTQTPREILIKPMQ